jgi:AraC family transcriptional regulator
MGCARLNGAHLIYGTDRKVLRSRPAGSIKTPAAGHLRYRPMSPRKAADRETTDPQQPSDEAALIDAHLAAITWIEAHLFEPMTVKSIADYAGYSASRFSRGFTRLQGESVMSYVRGRRLEAAMGRLLAEPDLRIVDLAFDSGFDSQEAFTRAFVRAFGHPPGRLRSLGPVRAVMRRKKAPAHEPEIHERVEQVPELHLAGLVRRITHANPAELPRTWQRLESLRGFPGEVDASTYAVLLRFDHGGDGELLSALRVSADASPPPELERHRLPPATCAVFRHVVRRGDVFPQVGAAREWIYSHHVPRLAWRRKSPPFEVFPRGLQVSPGSWVDHYFPLEE